MRTRLAAYAGLASLLVGGCAGEEGGGALGFVAFDKNHHVSAAEPLFGKEEDRCLDSPAFLLALYAGDADPEKDAAVAALPERYRGACRQVMGAIRSAMAFGSFADGTRKPGNKEPYSDRQRNEVIDALMAASNRKCGRYVAFLQQYDANINSTLGIAAQATAIIASVVSGGTAQGFAAASGIAGGARGTLNNAHFQNQTIGVLTNAFENSRAQQRLEISRRQQCAPAKYTMMRGLEDAFRYHGSCSIVFGLKQAQRAVDEAASPNLDSFNQMLDQLTEAQGKMAKLSGKRLAGDAAVSPDSGGTAPDPAPSGGGTSPTSQGTSITVASGGAAGMTGMTQSSGDQSAAGKCPFDQPPPTTLQPGANTPPAKKPALKKPGAKKPKTRRG